MVLRDAVAAAPAVETYEPGQDVQAPVTGDFYLTHGDGLLSECIRVGQRLRFRGPDATYAWYNHAGIFVGSDGEIVEAQSRGVVKCNISGYTPKQYTVVRTGAVADERDQQRMAAFACAAVGEGYGWLTIASTTLHLLTGGRLVISLDGTTICSALVARCLERSALIDLADPVQMMPADLAKLFNVKAPTG